MRRLAQLGDLVAAVDWRWWALAAIAIAAVGLIAEFLVHIFDSRERGPGPADPVDEVPTMGEQLAADWAAAGYTPDEPTAIDLGVYALTPAAEQRAPAGPTPPLLLDLRPPSGEYPIHAPAPDPRPGVRHRNNTMDMVPLAHIADRLASERVNGGEPR